MASARYALVLVLVVSAALGGCTAVAPWERGNLAKPQMAPEALAAQRALLDHVYGSREAAPPGGAARGGGCGCY